MPRPQTVTCRLSCLLCVAYPALTCAAYRSRPSDIVKYASAVKRTISIREPRLFTCEANYVCDVRDLLQPPERVKEGTYPTRTEKMAGATPAQALAQTAHNCPLASPKSRSVSCWYPRRVQSLGSGCRRGIRGLTFTSSLESARTYFLATCGVVCPSFWSFLWLS